MTPHDFGERGSVLDVRELFRHPWAGEGIVERPAWARMLPMPDRFEFRTEIIAGDDAEWEVLDTMTLPNGRVIQRRMRCTRLGPTSLRLTAADMPGGAELTERQDGFDFSSYVIRHPVGRFIRIPIRHDDAVRITAHGRLEDTIRLRFGPVRIGTVRLTLLPVD